MKRGETVSHSNKSGKEADFMIEWIYVLELQCQILFTKGGELCDFLSISQVFSDLKRFLANAKTIPALRTVGDLEVLRDGVIAHLNVYEMM